ncbi:MAG: 50S ribosomal protein L9 [Firmicutes bacterium]|nr:50S ribosomal protein L9 [Bacillota bacterium]
MLVLLKQDVKGSGKAGDIVKVSDGYARNMLLPKGLAVEATDANIRAAEKQKERIAQKAAEDRAAAEELSEALKEKSITIKAKAGEGGRLFGAITSKDIAEAASAQLNLEIDKKKIELDSPIKSVGTYTAILRLYSEIKGELNISVESEE